MSEHQFNVDDLGALVGARRREEKLSLREAAAQIEISFNTLARVERGHIPDLDNFRRIVAWLGLPAERFFVGPRVRYESTPELIAEHLRADPHLAASAAQQIEQLVRNLYTALATQDAVLAAHLRAARTFEPRAAALFGRLVEDMRRTLEQGDDA